MKKTIITSLAIIMLLSLTSCNKTEVQMNENDNKPQITETNNNDLENNQKETMSEVKMENIFPETDLFATLKTNKGDIKIKLATKDAPITVANFVGHANNNYYDGVIFHRIISNFMIQGGDPDGTGMGGTSIYGDKFADEFSENQKNNPYTISMANAGPNTNGSQFFINVAANNFLDNKHSVFGEVVEGKDIVDTIKAVETGANDKPVEDVIINDIEITNEGSEFTLDIEKAKSNYKIFESQAEERQKKMAEEQNKVALEKVKVIEEEKKATQKAAMDTNPEAIVSTGSTVSVDYKGTLDDGEIFDTSEGRPTLDFQVGAGQMIPGFDKAVIGMKIGDTKTFKIEAVDAYGEDTVAIPKAEVMQYVASGATIEAGKPLILTTGATLEILETSEESITIKNNHPLANQALNFEVEIINIK